VSSFSGEPYKQLSILGYWLGLISAILALLFRAFAAFNVIPPHMGLPGGNAISYLVSFTVPRYFSC
jgi:hypothetical protein